MKLKCIYEAPRQVCERAMVLEFKLLKLLNFNLVKKNEFEEKLRDFRNIVIFNYFSKEILIAEEL